MAFFSVSANSLSELSLTCSFTITKGLIHIINPITLIMVLISLLNSNNTMIGSRRIES